ncbi:hypothetical protein KDD17_11585 [Sulfitobacter albidus]|uniref:Uncharacterized protein n=1 Tax=Sulfitobacter albidus TaxID=2829501 RepID=A0A975JC26_9RHOB|nr:hypothetical protein [Sulfitobacter albidus]QUJ75597.1 hypothetical protein KDD17_11585 [Sulfitobacter albidus]
MNTPLALFRPDLRTFVKRAFIVTALTAVIVALAGWGIGTVTGYWQAMAVGPILVIAYFAVDDPQKWRAVRGLRWQLTDTHLNVQDSEGETPVPLAAIDKVLERSGGRVVVVMASGLRLAMPYLSDPVQVAAHIRRAADRMHPPTGD